MGRRFKIIQRGKPRKCKVQQKTIFPTQDQASAAMMRAWGHDPSVNILDMHTYFHQECGGWHFGHISYYQQSLEKNARSLSQPS